MTNLILELVQRGQPARSVTSSLVFTRDPSDENIRRSIGLKHERQHPTAKNATTVTKKKLLIMPPVANEATSLLPTNHEFQKLQRTLSGAGAADTSWFKISFVIVANFLGTGVLSLPYATASLGWVFAYVALVVCTLGALFSGVIFSRLNDRFPEARVYADVAREAWGARGDTLVRAVSYTYMGGVLVAFHLTCTIALEKTFYSSGICAPYWSLVVAGVLLALAQIRSLNEVGSLAIVGSIAIIVPIVLVCESLVQDGRGAAGNASSAFNVSMMPPPLSLSLSQNASAAPDLSPLFPAKPKFVDIGVAVTNMIFAFAGQVIFIELQAEMEKPQHFVKAMSGGFWVLTGRGGVGVGLIPFLCCSAALAPQISLSYPSLFLSLTRPSFLHPLSVHPPPSLSLSLPLPPPSLSPSPPPPPQPPPLLAATLTMTVTYAIMMFFGYYYLGNHAPAPITNALSDGIKLRVVNAVLLAHVIIACA